ncbi:MAG: PAC2 family protein, partial [Bifidobacteriaceae bacterium]|nr:PAC2 family protein [Bifidobacteriaceae bacterium]
MTSTLYSLDPAVVAEAQGTAPVLLYAFDGFVDAGIAAGLAINDFATHGEARRLATFSADELVDYRSRRPPMVLGASGWEAVHTQELAIDLVHDAQGTGFLLMYGPEPDLRWE